MMRNPLIGVLFGIAFCVLFVPVGWLVRLRDPLQLRRSARASYLRMLQKGHGDANGEQPSPELPRKT